MELFFIMLGAFAILLVIFLIIKDFGTGNVDKVQKVIEERNTHISSQPFKFVQSPDLFKKNTIDDSRKHTMGVKMKEYRFLIILVAFSVAFLVVTMGSRGIQSYNEEKKERLYAESLYDEPYDTMLEANENDVESLSDGIHAFRWYEKNSNPDDKMIKKFNEIVTLYLEHEEVKNKNIHSLSDAQAMRNYVADLENINENSDYLGDSQKEMMSKFTIENLWDIVESYEEKEERKNNPTMTITTTSTAKYDPFISMTDYEVIEDSTWGKPKSINKTETAYGVREQWVYDRGYLYFEDGYLTSIQSSR